MLFILYLYISVSYALRCGALIGPPVRSAVSLTILNITAKEFAILQILNKCVICINGQMGYKRLFVDSWPVGVGKKRVKAAV